MLDETTAVTAAFLIGSSVGLAAGYVAGFLDGWTGRRIFSAMARLVRWVRRVRP